MKIIKIGALWCGACLSTNKAWNEFKQKHDFEFEELDYDLDEEEVEKYNVGEKLPVIICGENRLIGEKKYDEILEFVKENS